MNICTVIFAVCFVLCDGVVVLKDETIFLQDDEYPNLRCVPEEKPPLVWIERINSGRTQRLCLLEEQHKWLTNDLILDFFRMGRGRNYFVSVVASNNRLDVAVQADEGWTAVTNITTDLTSELAFDFKRHLQTYKYSRIVGFHGLPYVQVSVGSDAGVELSRWFDAPAWPEFMDRQIINSVLKVRKDEVWAAFFRLYRKIMPTINEFIDTL